MIKFVVSRHRGLVFLKRFAMLVVFWLALTSNGPSAWFVGALSSAVAAAISLRLLPPKGYEVRLRTVLGQTPGFLWRSLLGGIDVAFRAFHPRLPISPAWLVYPVRLPPGAPRVWLGNVVSLVPGTLAAGGSGEALYVHCLDSEGPAGGRIAAEEHEIAKSVGLTLDGPHV